MKSRLKKLKYSDRQMRRDIFRDMIAGGKKYTTLIIPHVVVFHMEEHGLDELAVRRKFRWKSWDYDRQIVKLYFLRKEMHIKHQAMGLKKFGGSIW